MSHFERHQKQREFRLQLEREFPDFELVKWYAQFRELKAGYPDTVLLYRLGDFYETFDDDAKLVAELLDVTLTSKHFATHKRTNVQQRAPMAGMPYHAIERYVGAIVGAGYRVAIAEQTSETPSSKSDTRPKSMFASGIEQRAARRDIVDREVVRVITPGTVIEPGMLSAVQNNYLTALIAEGGRVGLAYADLSTGEFCCTEFSGERAATEAQGELARLQAVEVLVPDDPALRLPGLDPASARLEHDLEFMTKDERELLLPGERVARRIAGENNARWAHGHLTGWPAWRWKLQTAADALMQQLHVRSLDGFGLRDKPLAARAAGAVIQYIHDTQRSAADQINMLHTYTSGGTMFLDPQTRRNLELLEGSGGTTKASLVGVWIRRGRPWAGGCCGAGSRSQCSTLRAFRRARTAWRTSRKMHCCERACAKSSSRSATWSARSIVWCRASPWLRRAIWCGCARACARCPTWPRRWLAGCRRRWTTDHRPPTTDRATRQSMTSSLCRWMSGWLRAMAMDSTAVPSPVPNP